MEANKLMIGDLLCVNKDGLCIKKGTIVRALSIDGEDKLKEKGLVGTCHCRPLDGEQFDVGTWLEFLDPIPLTPEILEKNGFKQTSNSQYGGEYTLADDYYDITAKTISDGIWQIEYECIEMSGIPSSRVNISHIHELQQFLRLCGVQKYITL